MKGHVIVCGLGQVGYRIVDLLSRLGESVHVITLASPREDWLQDVRARNIPVTIGDARDERLLLEAGLHEAKALIAATDRDLANIEVALDAVRLRPDLSVVVRLFDQGLARHLEVSFDIRRALGMSSLAGPTFAAAALGERAAASFDAPDARFTIGRVEVRPGTPFFQTTVGAVAQHQHLFVITQESGPDRHVATPGPDTPLQEGDRLVVVAETSVWRRHFAPSVAGTWWHRLREIGHALAPTVWLGYLWQMWSEAALSIRTVFVVFNLLILTSVFVFHSLMNLSLVDALYFVTTTVTTVGYGDITLHDASTGLKLYGCGLMVLGSATLAVLFSLVTDFVVTSRFQQLLGQQQIPDQGHVIVVGIGNLGFKTAEELHRHGTAVVGIDRDAQRDFIDSLRQRVPVLIGDGRVSSVLSRAGIERASALVATTSNDLMNLAVALAAKQLNPKVRTVVRLFDPDFAHKVQSVLNVDVAQSDSRIAAPTFVASALEDGVQNAYIRGTTMFMVVHRAVRPEWVGHTPDWLLQQHGIRVLLHRGQEHHRYTPLAADETLAADGALVGLVQRALTH